MKILKNYRNQVIKIYFTEQEKQEIIKYCAEIGKPMSSILANIIKTTVKKENNNRI